MWQAFSTTSAIAIGSRSTSSLPASIFEKSRMSLMMTSSEYAESVMVSTISTW